MSADEIINNLSHLSLAQVYGALSYYHDHRAEIDQEIREADEQFQRLKNDPAFNPQRGQ